jgi:hypothetical protein
MARFKSPALIAAALLASAALVAPVQADMSKLNMDVAYSATRIIEGGPERGTQRVQRLEQRYFQQSAMTNRMEQHHEGQHSVIIMNGDRGVMWIVMPSQRMYMESPIDGQPFDGANVEIPDPDTWAMERVGRESVNGIPATKYFVSSDNGQTDRMKGHMWVSDEGIPLRTDLMAGTDRIQMELRDLVVGPQPAALFEPPAGFQRLDLGTGMGGAGLFEGLTGMPGVDAATEGGMTTSGEGEDPGFVDELASETTEAAKSATREEIHNSVRESVSKGLRKLLPGSR